MTTLGATGAVQCTCRTGFETTFLLDGTVACTDIDECERRTDSCDGNAQCANVVGTYSCVCNPGYAGDGFLCLQLDECVSGANNCDAHASCTDAPGSFTCACLPGYTDADASLAPGVRCAVDNSASSSTASPSSSSSSSGRRDAATGPTLSAIASQTVKALVRLSVPFTVGHSDPTYDLSTLTITFSSNSVLVLASSMSVQGIGASRFLSLASSSKTAGAATVTLTVTDGLGYSASRSFVVTVLPLTPFFDDLGPQRTVTDIKTVAGTPTYPVTFLVGHEDSDLVGGLRVTASTGNVTVVPDVCCDPSSAAFISGGGIGLNFTTPLVNFQRAGVASQARKLYVTVRPAGVVTSPLGTPLTFRLTDAKGTVVSSTVKFYVYQRPNIDKFCSYDALATDTLQSIAGTLGMHWMTLFMMNNGTIEHPDVLPPGRRLVIGRPYRVRAGDSLNSIAQNFGTTWQAGSR